LPLTHRRIACEVLRHRPNRNPDQAFNLGTGPEVMRYYLNVRTHRELIVDNEGIDLPDLGDVAEEAIQAARDIVADRIKHGEKVDDGVFEVLDPSGTTVMTIPIRSVLRL
jgi:hypothetical protein